ncbi:MAG: GlsB/YeaQ/YmgE family stress response membrane protein, partial [Rhodospirillaceae bacterium]|nr:GlsB/YeaQ/YmgE family stress response membrane protein [Rhodospirillaceae bacterium]
MIGSVDQILVIVIVGGFAGWLAAALLRVRALSIVGTMIVGVAGSFVGIVLF